MDAFYIFRHSPHGDEELRYSLRSVAAHLPWIRKVWIFGDRPAWLTDDTVLAEHVPHESLAWIAGRRTPVRNQFVMMFLSSLLPGLSEEYLWFCDDYVLLADADPDFCRRPRMIQDLAQVKNRGTGLFKDALWRTFEVLKRLGYPGMNYEVHAPVLLRKQQVLAAVHDFRDFMSDDRHFGLLAKTAVLNHAQRSEGFKPIRIAEEGTYVGFHYRPARINEIHERCRGRTFLNFDDAAYSVDLREFLNDRFPTRSRFERDLSEPAVIVDPAPARHDRSTAGDTCGVDEWLPSTWQRYTLNGAQLLPVGQVRLVYRRSQAIAAEHVLAVSSVAEAIGWSVSLLGSQCPPELRSQIDEVELFTEPSSTVSRSTERHKDSGRWLVSCGEGPPAVRQLELDSETMSP